MRFIYPIFFALIFLIASSYAAQAQNYTSLDMVAGQSHAVPGQTFDIALVQNIADGWHTYWVNPGDAGEPIGIDWTLPNGVSVSKLNFPVPQKIAYQGLTDYGYNNRAIYTATVTVSDDYAGTEIALNGSATMLVCNDICIPETAQIALNIPVQSTGQSTDVNGAIFNTAKLSMPTRVDWNAGIERVADETVVTISPPADMHNQFTDVTLFPYDWGVIDNTAFALSDIGDETITISQAAGDRSLLELSQAQFIIQTNNNAYLITAKPSITIGFGDGLNGSIFIILAFAFLGGLILNLMPCVFPILSMKALSLLKMSGYERRHAQLSGLAYTGGVIASLICVAGLLIVLKDAGARIGWGFQLQNPFVIFGLFILFIAIALNLWGVFNIGGRFISLGSKMTNGNDIRASFFTGILAMVVATPCTAPFMATAIGFALTQNAFIALSVFAMLGFGLAFPYLILCFVPQTQKILPKPGPWMVTFKKILAIPMVLSAVWLLWVFAQQINIINTVDNDTAPFTRAGLTEILNDNLTKPVFVNMTAAWCITCLVNEKTSLSSQSVRDAFAEANVIYVKGDWTNRDNDISSYLNEFDRDGVPLYVYYAPANAKGLRDNPVILPQILTPSIIIDTINNKE